MRKIFLLLILFFNYKAAAQYQLGVSTGNYSGTNGMYLNPSSIADSRYKIYVNIAGLDHNIVNDYTKWSSTFPYWAIYAGNLPIPDAWKSKLTDERIDLTGETAKLRLLTNQSSDAKDIDITNFKQSGDSKVRLNANTNFNLQLLAAHFEIPKLKATIGFGMRNRIMFDVRNLSEISAKFFVSGTNSSYNSNFVGYENKFPQSFDAKFSILKETSVTFAKEIFNDGTRQLKIGGTYKLNGGVFHLGMKVDNSIFTLTNITPSSGTSEAINQITISSADNASMYITPDANLKTFGMNFTNPLKIINPFAIFDKNQMSGFGMGGDLGITYEVLDPDIDFTSRKFKNIEKTKNKYILKISASINDIGYTRYKSTAVGDVKYFVKDSIDFTSNKTQLNLHNLAKFGFGKNSVAFTEDWFNSSVNALQAKPISDGFTVGLPTNFVLNVDYKLVNNVYIGGILIQNVANLFNKYSQPAPSVFAILPRFETKYFDASLPISLNNRYENLQVGLGLRIGPLYLGTDHLASFLNLKSQKGGGFYLGATVPVYHKQIKKDLDGDYGTISLMEQIRQYSRKRHLRKLHRKEMKRG